MYDTYLHAFAIIVVPDGRVLASRRALEEYHGNWSDSWMCSIARMIRSRNINDMYLEIYSEIEKRFGIKNDKLNCTLREVPTKIATYYVMTCYTSSPLKIQVPNAKEVKAVSARWVLETTNSVNHAEIQYDTRKVFKGLDEQGDWRPLL